MTDDDAQVDLTEDWGRLRPKPKPTPIFIVAVTATPMRWCIYRYECREAVKTTGRGAGDSAWLVQSASCVFDSTERPQHDDRHLEVKVIPNSPETFFTLETAKQAVFRAMQSCYTNSIDQAKNFRESAARCEEEAGRVQSHIDRLTTTLGGMTEPKPVSTPTQRSKFSDDEFESLLGDV